MIIKNLIKETTAFQKLNQVQQNLFLKKNNIELIRHGYVMSNMTSYENWVQKVSPRMVIEDIVKELVEKNKAPN